MLDLIRRLVKEEEGQGMVEYGLILALISIIVIGMLTNIGQKLLAKFTTINTSLQ